MELEDGIARISCAQLRAKRQGGFCMKFRYLLRLALFATALWSGWNLPANAQVGAETKIAPLEEIKNQADLDKAITALDTKLFDAYNTVI